MSGTRLATTGHTHKATLRELFDSELERGFLEACLRDLEAAVGSPGAEAAALDAEDSSSPAAEAVALYERVTRLGIEVRTAQLVMLAILAVILIQCIVLIVSPVFFSLNLLIGLLGLVTRRRRKTAVEKDPTEPGSDS